MKADMTACILFAKLEKDFGTEENALWVSITKKIRWFFDIRKGFWRSLADSSLDFD